MKTLGVLIIAIVLALIPNDSWATGPVTFGVQYHGMWDSYTDEERHVVLSTLSAAGVTDVRIDVSWAMIEPEQGKYSEWGLNKLDNNINLATSYGLRPLVTFWMAPQWANGSTDERVPVTSKKGLAALEKTTAMLSSRYAGRVDAWEFWNEPNDPDFMRGADPKVYAKMLRYAYKGFKSGGATVVFGGTSYVDVPWITKAIRAGATFDVMAVHPYMFDQSPTTPYDGTIWHVAHIKELKKITNKPIWFTEFGWRAGDPNPDAPNWLRNVTYEQQTQYLFEMIEFASANGVERVYWYRDRAVGDNKEYGLIYPDGTPTPTLESYRLSHS